MKQLCALLLFLLAPVMVMANEKITLINWYPAGGSIDQYYQIIKKNLESNGHTVELEYVKTCAQALSRLQKSKNVFTATSASAFIPQSASSSCRDLTIESKSPKIFSTMYNSAFDICYSKSRQLTQNDIFHNTVKIGAVAESFSVYLNYWIKKTNNPNLSMTLYSGSGEIRRAILAGDIDVWFGSFGLHATVAGRYHCFASSLKNNPTNLPFMGSIIKDPEFPELQQVFVLWSSELLSPQVATAMAQTFKTADFMEFVKQGEAVHTGIGAGGDVNRDIRLLKRIENFYSNPTLK